MQVKQPSTSRNTALPVVYGSKPLMSNRFDELLLKEFTSRQQSAYNVASVQQSAESISRDLK
jgi:hypothetical protein